MIARRIAANWRNTFAREEGSSIVEMGLSASLLFISLFGLMEFCLAGYSYFYVSEAAREATRYAMVRGDSQASDCTSAGPANCIAQTGSTGDIQAYVANNVLPGINPNNISVATTYLNSDGTSCGTTDVCKVAGDIVQSTVTYSLPLTIPFIPAKTITMTSTSQMFISY